VDDEILAKLNEIQSSIDGKVADAQHNVESALNNIDDARALIDRIKDNIAYILGLPAAIGGSFGFLWDSGNEQAQLAYQVEQLQVVVEDLQNQNDLLGGNQKNFSLDFSGAPGGSILPIVVGAGVIVLIGVLFWYQARRRRQSTNG
jgi:tetrahydromethanopterin S-methyltransferase subunit F